MFNINTCRPVQFHINSLCLTLGWCEAVTRTAYIGEKATIRCHYHPHDSGGHKYFCKHTTKTMCDVMVSTNTAISAQDRFFIYDYKQVTALIIIISRVSDSDSGQYWCMRETGEGRSLSFDTVEFWGEHDVFFLLI